MSEPSSPDRVTTRTNGAPGRKTLTISCNPCAGFSKGYSRDTILLAPYFLTFLAIARGICLYLFGHNAEELLNKLRGHNQKSKATYLDVKILLAFLTSSTESLQAED